MVAPLNCQKWIFWSRKRKKWRKLRKSIRPNHQYPWAPAKPEVDLDFRGHPNMGALWNWENGFLDLKNVGNEETTKIHETQSSVLSSTCQTESWPGFSRSPKHGSFVKPPKLDSLTRKTCSMLWIKFYAVDNLRKLRLRCKSNNWKVTTLIPEVGYIIPQYGVSPTTPKAWDIREKFLWESEHHNINGY